MIRSLDAIKAEMLRPAPSPMSEPRQKRRSEKQERGVAHLTCPRCAKPAFGHHKGWRICGECGFKVKTKGGFPARQSDG